MLCGQTLSGLLSLPTGLRVGTYLVPDLQSKWLSPIMGIAGLSALWEGVIHTVSSISMRAASLYVHSHMYGSQEVSSGQLKVLLHSVPDPGLS